MNKASHKLSVAQRNEVARRYYEGESPTRLAREFGIHRTGPIALAEARNLRRAVKKSQSENWARKVERLTQAGLISGVIPRIGSN
jgi:DNA-directed RNA polymerase specialized sigma24 family protein